MYPFPGLLRFGHTGRVFPVPTAANDREPNALLPPPPFAMPDRTLSSHRVSLVASVVALFVVAALGGSASPAFAQPATDAAASTDSTEAEHPLWRVTSGADTLHMLGSVHLLRPDAYPLAPTIQHVIERAEKVAFEVDLDSMQAAAPMMLGAGMYQSDSTLQHAVSDSTYALLQSAIDTLAVPEARVRKMRPWLASLMVTSAVMQRSGYQMSLGIDQHVYQKARERGAEVVGLETLREQIDILSAASSGDPDAYLRYSLENLSASLDQVARIMEGWKAGDVERIARVMNEGMDEFPAVREHVLVRRNRNWIAPIEDLMQDEKTVLVVVGVGHLVGEESVTQMLRDRGYTVEQL